MKQASGFVVRWTLLLCALSALSCAAPQSKIPVYSDEALVQEQRRQQCLFLEERIRLENRLQQLSFPILRAAHPMTSQHRKLYGFYFIAPSLFAPEYIEAAAEVFGLKDRLKVTQVISGSPAQKAGVQAGDEIVSINGVAPPRELKELQAYLEKLQQDHNWSVVLSREGAAVTAKLIPETGVDSAVALVDSDAVNAWTDGRDVFMTRGMMRFAGSDTELEMVISHELAHRVRGHVDMMKKNVLVGGLLGLLVDLGAAAAGVSTGGEFLRTGMQAGQLVYSKDMEREADYVGMYILAAAGGDIDKGPDIFRRFGASFPGSTEIRYAGTHPSSPERFVMLEQTVREIRRKQAAGLPLVPEEKKQP